MSYEAESEMWDAIAANDPGPARPADPIDIRTLLAGPVFTDSGAVIDESQPMSVCASCGQTVLTTPGYRLEAVDVGGPVSLERLDLALQRVRGIAWNLPACLSCDDAGCVLCSCADDRCRQAAVDCNAMPATPDPQPTPVPSVASSRRGRPAAIRAELPDVAAAMRDVRRLRDEADRLRDEAAELEYRALKQAWSTHSLADIAATAGVTRARIHQIVKSR
jgi:hypothetical protein